MDSIRIPEKTFFKIGEVAKLLDLESYVLRYWETEFEQLKPQKTRSGQRSYQRSDIELLIGIKHLLYDEMYTIAGARRQLERLQERGERPSQLLSDVEPTQDDTHFQLCEARERIEELDATVSALRRERDVLRAELEAVERDAAQTDLLSMAPVEPRDTEEIERLHERIATLNIENEELQLMVDRASQRGRDRLASLRRELEVVAQAVH